MLFLLVVYFRSQGSSKQNGGESESSDISTAELEILRPTFAIKRSSAPVLDVTQSETYTAKTVNIVRTHVPVTHAQRKPSGDINLSGFKNSYTEKLNTNGGHTDTTSSSSLESEVSKGSSQRKNSSSVFGAISLSKPTKKAESQVVETKRGVNQVDFRGVLKKNPSPWEPESNGIARKPVSNPVTPILRRKENHLDLTQRKALFEADGAHSNKNSSETINTKRKDSGTCEKINLARKQFEDNVSSAQSDFRSVLKPKKNETSGVKGKENSPVKPQKIKPELLPQHDFRSVLKAKHEAEHKDTINFKTLEARPAKTHDLKVKIPAAFDNVEKVKRRPEPRLSLDISRDRPKIDPARSVRNNRLKEITDKLEFKSVLKPIDTEKIRTQEKQNGEVTVLRPIPRRLSNSKQTNMDAAAPRRLSQSKGSMMEVKPVFKELLDDKSVEYGSEVVLECQVTGQPNPDISWSVNDTEIRVRV